MDTSFESVPRYYRQPRTVLRDQLRAAALALLADSQRVSVLRLRECGVRGGTAALIALREELVASGELPPEAAARIYARPLHPPGRRRTEDGRLRTEERPNSSSDLGATPQAGFFPSDLSSVLRPQSSVLPKLSRAQRRSRRLIERYNSAVRNVFGEDRARQIGAAP